MKSASQVARESREQHGKRFNSLQGATLLNANGDIDLTGLGYQIAIDTLTYIKKQVVEQSFYMIEPAKFVPMPVGEGSFAQAMLTNLSLSTSGKFEEGIINQGSNNDRLATADAAVTAVSVPVINWAKSVGYSIFEVQQALLSGNWDPIEQKHRARKENWDLGIQEIAFLGASSRTDVRGLINQSDVNINTTLVPVPISEMSVGEFSTFVGTIIAAYLTNCNQTRYPNIFVMPLSDYVGLAVPVSTSAALGSKLEYLRKAFAEIVPGGVEIMATAYNNAEINNDLRGLNKNRYVLYRKDVQTLRMDIPVDYTTTSPGTLNNFQFQDAAYAQFTGVKAYKPLEVLYLDETAV